MEALELKAEARPAAKGLAKHLRQQGLVPAVVYGKHQETLLVQIEAKPLQKVISAAGTHQLISLQIANQKPIITLAREIQRDQIKRNFLHVDFMAVSMDEKITAHVPLALVGESRAVYDLGGILTQNMDEIEIECFPADLVAAIEVNIEKLVELNDSLLVSDLIAPDNIIILSDPTSMVVRVEAPRTAEALEALDAALTPTIAEPQVLTEAKRDDE